MSDEDKGPKIPEHLVHRLNLIAALGAESAAARSGLILEGIRTGYILNASAIGLLALGSQLLGFVRLETGWHSIPFFASLTTTALAHFLAYFGQTKTTEYYAALIVEQLAKWRSVEPEHESPDSDRHGNHSTLFANLALASMLFAFCAFVSGGAWLLFSSLAQSTNLSPT